MNEKNKMIVYSSQSEAVLSVLERDGVCFSKREYIKKKYEDSASIFIAAYRAFVMEAQKYVPKPEGAEYPYWAFKDLYNIDMHWDTKLLILEVPIDEIIFFDMYDWNKVLNLKYIGESEEDEFQFIQMLASRGIKRESDIILTDFYPDLKRKVQDSWKRLFRHHIDIKKGNIENVRSVQLGLWQIKKEWIV